MIDKTVTRPFTEMTTEQVFSSWIATVAFINICTIFFYFWFIRILEEMICEGLTNPDEPDEEVKIADEKMKLESAYDFRGHNKDIYDR